MTALGPGAATPEAGTTGQRSATASTPSRAGSANVPCPVCGHGQLRARVLPKPCPYTEPHPAHEWASFTHPRLPCPGVAA